jgi:hypothetical protein
MKNLAVMRTERRETFNEAVGKQLGEPFKESELSSSFDISVMTPDYEVYYNDETLIELVPEVDDIVGTSEYDLEGYNSYITTQVLLSKGDAFMIDGNPIGW